MATAPSITIETFDNPPESRGRPRNPLPDAYATALIDAVAKLEGNAVANATGDKQYKTKSDARKRGDNVKRELKRRGCLVTVRIWENTPENWVVGIKRAPEKSEDATE